MLNYINIANTKIAPYTLQVINKPTNIASCEIKKLTSHLGKNKR